MHFLILSRQCEIVECGGETPEATVFCPLPALGFQFCSKIVSKTHTVVILIRFVSYCTKLLRDTKCHSQIYRRKTNAMETDRSTNTHTNTYSMLVVVVVVVVWRKCITVKYRPYCVSHKKPNYVYRILLNEQNRAIISNSEQQISNSHTTQTQTNTQHKTDSTMSFQRM